VQRGHHMSDVCQAVLKIILNQGHLGRSCWFIYVISVVIGTSAGGRTTGLVLAANAACFTIVKAGTPVMEPAMQPMVAYGASVVHTLVYTSVLGQQYQSR
jgi:hypothetical protein